MRARFIILLLALVAALVPGSASATSNKWPVGIYSLSNGGTGTIDSDSDPVLLQPYVDGFRCQFVISQIQPDNWDGTHSAVSDAMHFDWSIVDTAVNRARARGKHIGISISWGRYCPAWLQTLLPTNEWMTVDPEDNSLGNGVQYWQPYPWGPTYQYYLKRFIDAFAARYDANPVVSYVILTGTQQLNENRLINIVDASVTLNDMTVTNVGSYAKVDSASAQFVTRTGGGGSAGIVGKTISDPAQSIFRGSSLVISTTTTPAAPADPTDTTVYLSRTAFTTGSSLSGNVEGWLVGQGDESKANANARDVYGYSEATPVGSYYTKTWTPPASTGFASTRAYLDAYTAISDYWVSRFQHTPINITGQSPFSDSNVWGALLASYCHQHLNTYLLGGYMTASLYDICAVDYNPANIISPGHPKGDQAIHLLLNSGTYKGTCGDGSTPPADQATRAHGQAEAALEHGDAYLETYYPDAQANSDGGLTAAAWTAERPRFSALVPIDANRGVSLIRVRRK